MSAKLQLQLKQNLTWRGLYYISTFIITIITSRILKANDAGAYAYLLTVISFAILIGSLNLDAGFTYFTSSKKISVSKLIITALIWVGIVGCLAAIFLTKSFINYSNINVLKYSLFYFVGLLLIIYATGLFYGLNNFTTPNKILLISNIFYIG